MCTLHNVIIIEQLSIKLSFNFLTELSFIIIMSCSNVLERLRNFVIFIIKNLLKYYVCKISLHNNRLKFGNFLFLNSQQCKKRNHRALHRVKEVCNSNFCANPSTISIQLQRLINFSIIHTNLFPIFFFFLAIFNKSEARLPLKFIIKIFIFILFAPSYFFFYSYSQTPAWGKTFYANFSHTTMTAYFMSIFHR